MAIPFINALPEAPQRTDARPNFALRADVFFAAIDPMRYQMNQMAAWMNDQRDDIYSYSDNVEAWMNATLAARNAAQAAATNAAASESAAKDHLDDTAALIAAFTPTGDPLPEVTSVNAPLVVATPQGGVKFSRRALNNGIGIRPALRFDFVNQGYLDPRITFTRATPDWDEYGNRYEANEPILSDEGLWLWGSRANLVPFNRDLTNGWSRNLVTVSYDEALGFSTVQMQAPNSSVIYNSADIVKDRLYTLQATVRPVQLDNGEIRILLYHTLFSPERSDIGCHIRQNGSVVTIGIPLDLVVTKLKDGWYKIKFSAVAKETAGTADAVIYTDARGISGAPTVGLQYEIKDVQLEQGEATPVIPTNGSQVTVAASTLEVLAGSLSDKFNPFEGTIVWRVGRNHYSSAANTPPYANIGIVGSGANNGLLAISGNNFVYHDSNGDYQESLAVPAQPLSNDEFTIAYTYTKTGVSVSHNGELAAVEWDVSEFLENAVNRLYVSGLTNGYVRSLSYYDRALTDEQAKELTS